LATPTDRGDEPLLIRTVRRLERARVLDHERESAHLRTTDVDILMAFHAALDADLWPLEEALERGGF
jgi:hypothetical protein